MAAQYVVVALKVENIHSGWLSSGKLVAPKEDNIQKTVRQTHLFLSNKGRTTHQTPVPGKKGAVSP